MIASHLLCVTTRGWTRHREPHHLLVACTVSTFEDKKRVENGRNTGLEESIATITQITLVEWQKGISFRVCTYFDVYVFFSKHIFYVWKEPLIVLRSLQIISINCTINQECAVCLFVWNLVRADACKSIALRFLKYIFANFTQRHLFEHICLWNRK